MRSLNLQIKVSILFIGFTCFFASIHFLCSFSIAAPRFDRVETLADGTVILQDTTEPKVYYYIPQRIELARFGEKPQFLFLKSFRLDARSGEINTGGVISLKLQFPVPSLGTDERWRSLKGSAARFRPLPVTNAFYRLIMTEAKGDTSSVREVATGGAPWKEKTVNLVLSGPTATLLWDALKEPGTVALYVDLTLTTPGYVLEQKPGEDPEYKKEERVDRFSVPLRISLKEYPGLFKILDRQEKMSFKRRDLTVYCFDFANQLINELERVVVEVSVANKRGQRRTRTALFDKESDSIREIAFDVPERREDTYRYRVTRILGNGDKLVEHWKESDAAYLDVSWYEIEVSAEE